jgi:hypothetical protein
MLRIAATGRRVVIVLAFVKRTRNTSDRLVRLAPDRMLNTFLLQICPFLHHELRTSLSRSLPGPRPPRGPSCLLRERRDKIYGRCGLPAPTLLHSNGHGSHFAVPTVSRTCLGFRFQYFFPSRLSGYFSANSLTSRSASFFFLNCRAFASAFPDGLFSHIRSEMVLDRASLASFCQCPAFHFLPLRVAIQVVLGREQDDAYPELSPACRLSIGSITVFKAGASVVMISHRIASSIRKYS